jgi:hypothetical protein
MYGCRPGGKRNPRDYRVYRCAANSTIGRGACMGTLEVREKRILDRIFATLPKEFLDMKKLLIAPPASLVVARHYRHDQRDELQASATRWQRRSTITLIAPWSTRTARYGRNSTARLPGVDTGT